MTYEPDETERWRHQWVAPVELKLMTPAALQHGLALMGWTWTPVAVTPAVRGDAATSSLGTSAGLYMWVDGVSPGDPMQRGGLYIGIGQNTDGVLGRLHYESTTYAHDPAHSHGMMLRRRSAIPVAGRIDGHPSRLSDPLRDCIATKGVTAVDKWLTARPPLAAAEHFAVRLSAHIGDTVSPVNSTFAGAWASDSGADWAALAVRLYLAQQVSPDD